MGQAQASSVWDTYAPNCDITPGTYRIIHDATDKVLQIHEENRNMVTLQRPQSEEQASDFVHADNDQWLVLRSGDGFIFKHCRENNYITAPWSAGRGPQPARATRYPTTWAIHTKRGSDDDKCIITIAFNRYEVWAGAECVGLVGEVSQRGVCFARLSETEEQNQLWRLERVGDTIVEEDWEHRVRELEREIQAANALWASSELRLETMLQQLDTKETRLENVRDELSKRATELEIVQRELSQQAAELKKQYVALDEIRELLDAKERAVSSRDSGVWQNEVIYEQNQDVSQDDGLQGLETTEEAILDEQAPQSEVQHPQHEETNNVVLSNPTILQPVPEPVVSPTNEIRNVHSPPLAEHAVDQRLAQLGWAFD
ncbi:hypothetical protein B0J17DRAFT_254540 [Rhizoctonia solani]|nr:hypothetical protein B0J17DRAFT_254540 [Rhizoctonia solani]